MCESTNVYADKVSVFFKKVAQVGAPAEILVKAAKALGEIVRDINN